MIDLGIPVSGTEYTHRSVSQLSQYERCPRAFYLNRIAKVWRRPAAWLPQGTAFHEVAEKIELGEINDLETAVETFKAVYAEHVEALTEITPNFDWWFASGPYKGERDIERRWNIGVQQVERYWEYRGKHPAERPIEGLVEYKFSIDLDGIEVKGAIDQVYTGPSGLPRIRDLKTGKKPGDSFQLGVYALAVADLDKGHPELGDYWMAQTGKPTMLLDLTEWDRDRVTEIFHTTEDRIRKGDFPAKPEKDKCNFCDVANSCDARF